MGIFQAILEKAEITESHMHPQFNVTVPNGAYRYSGITFNTLANGETVTLTYGGAAIVYTMETVLTAAGAGAVHVKVQGTVAASAAKLAQAIRGITDAANISYGAGTQPNPNITGHYTGVRTALGNVIHPAGPTIRLREIVPDVRATTANFLVADTTTHAGLYTLTAPVRTYFALYTMTGNVNEVSNENKIAGDLQCLIPIDTVIDSLGRFVKYDASVTIVEAISATSLLVEADIFSSLDEVTYSQHSQAQELSRELAAAGSQEYHTRIPRLAAGAGMYIRMRSNGNQVTDSISIKIQLHTYRYGL